MDVSEQYMDPAWADMQSRSHTPEMTWYEDRANLGSSHLSISSYSAMNDVELMQQDQPRYEYDMQIPRTMPHAQYSPLPHCDSSSSSEFLPSPSTTDVSHGFLGLAIGIKEPGWRPGIVQRSTEPILPSDGLDTWSPAPVLSPCMSVADSLYSFASEDMSQPEVVSPTLGLGDSFGQFGFASSPRLQLHSHVSTEMLRRSPLSDNASRRQSWPRTAITRSVSVGDFDEATPSSAAWMATRRRAPVRKQSKSNIIVQGSAVHRPPRGSISASRRQCEKLAVACENCNDVFMILNLRGTQEDLETDFYARYACAKCLANEAAAASSGNAHLPATASANGNKSIAHNLPSAYASCDVCYRDVGQGGVVAGAADVELNFGIELICSPCMLKYRRCSDCGGGGGIRLGTGKWRSKEVFTEARRTCTLSHSRAGNGTEAEYLIEHVSAIPNEAREQLVEECRSLFFHTMLSTLAVPEVLEWNVVEGVSTHAEVCRFTEAVWSKIETALTQPLPDRMHTERYLGIRRVKPNVRKKPSRQLSMSMLTDEPMEPTIAESWLSTNKTLGGFVIAEWDKAHGTLFFHSICPWGTGDIFDLLGELMTAIGHHVVAQRDLELERLGSKGYSKAEAEDYCPPVEHLWTSTFFKEDSKTIKLLEKKQGFVPLNDYLTSHPLASPLWFPPHRAVDGPSHNDSSWLVLAKNSREGVTLPQPPLVKKKSSNALGKTKKRA